MGKVSSEGALPFAYDPLDISQKDSIRLLKVIGTINGQSHCLLSPARVSNAEYHALSYTWGPKENEHEIIVNGKVLKIRRNLFDFLNRITEQPILYLCPEDRITSRIVGRTSLFWIDAICLDQSNIRECNHQVQQMYEIYEKAEGVLAWLGCGDPDIEIWLASANSRSCGANLPVSKSAVKKLLHLEYWSRPWIIQEIGLASDIWFLYGTHLESWKSLWKTLDEDYQSTIYTRSRRRMLTTDFAKPSR